MAACGTALAPCARGLAIDCNMVLLLDQLPGLPAVQELLALEFSALRARWEALGADALEEEIEKYKGALEQVLEELKRLGGRAESQTQSVAPCDQRGFGLCYASQGSWKLQTML